MAAEVMDQMLGTLRRAIDMARADIADRVALDNVTQAGIRSCEQAERTYAYLAGEGRERVLSGDLSLQEWARLAKGTHELVRSASALVANWEYTDLVTQGGENLATAVKPSTSTSVMVVAGLVALAVIVVLK